MKKFDVESIKNRMVGKIQESIKDINTENGLEEIGLVYEDSLIQALFSASAEVESEVVRYAEYLLKEKKWTKATNLSSIVSQAKYISYSPHRKASATGTVYFSADERIKTLPLSILSGATPMLVGDINIGDIVVDDKSNEFIVIATPELSSNSAYVSAQVMQGIKKTQYSVANGKPNEYIEINNDSVEDADNIVSGAFFKVYVNGVEWNKVNSLLASSTAYSQDYQIINSDDFSKIFVAFGNGKAGQKLAENDSVKIEYIETTGLDGNVFTNDKVTVIKSLITNLGTKKVYCSNKSRIAGGKDYDSIDRIKELAPIEYLKFYTIGNVESYHENILRLQPDISKLKIFGGSKESQGITQKLIYMTALSSASTDMYQDNINSGNHILESLSAKLADLKNPSDILEFYPITFIPIRIGASVFINEPRDSTDKIQKDLERALFIKYNKHARNFQENFYYSDLIALLHENDNVDYVKVQMSTVESMTNNNFNIFDYYKISEYHKNDDLSKNIYFLDKAVQFDFKFNNIFRESEFPGFTEKVNETGDFLLTVSIIAKDQALANKSRTLFYDPTFTEDSLFVYGYHKEWGVFLGGTTYINILFATWTGNGTDEAYVITLEDPASTVTLTYDATPGSDWQVFNSMVNPDAALAISVALPNKYIENIEMSDVASISYEGFEQSEVLLAGELEPRQAYLMTEINSVSGDVRYNYCYTMLNIDITTYSDFWASYFKVEDILINSELEIPAKTTIIDIKLKDNTVITINKPYEIASFIKVWNARKIKQFPKINFNVTNSTWNSRILQSSVAPFQIERYKKDSNGVYIKKSPVITESGSGVKLSYEERFDKLYDYPIKNSKEHVYSGNSPLDSLGDSFDSKELVDGIKLKFNNDYSSNDDTLFSGTLDLPVASFLADDQSTWPATEDGLKTHFLELYHVDISAIPKNKNIIGINPYTLIHSDYSNNDSESLIKVDVMYE